MATDKVQGNQTPKWADRNAIPGQRLDAATYIGIVKNNVDPLRSGRLEVWIPEFGASQNESESNSIFWRTVSYASPYFGSTYQPEASKNNSFENTNQTYGMWMVPPDIGNQVLCTFVNGDPNRGYWFACINPTLSHYMVPGIAAGNKLANASPAISSSVVNGSNPPQSLPVAEFNENQPDAIKGSFYENPKPIHDFQANVLFKQGLDRDSTRGAISSSSQRESPSQVFGFNTPGRPVNDPADDPAYKEKLARGEIKDSDYAIRVRKGGHQFVMDDGDTLGNDQLVRIRSAGGHQILMHDSKKTMYVANSEGSVWIELSESGHMHIYTAGGFNVRSEGDLNFHGKSIKMQAEGDFNISAGGGFNVSGGSISMTGIGSAYLYGGKVSVGSGGALVMSSGGAMTVGSGAAITIDGSTIDLNNGGGGNSIGPQVLRPNKHDDSTYDTKTRLWSTVKDASTSIVGIMPAHEPWARNASTLGPAPEKQVNDSVCPPKSSSAGNIAGIPAVLDGDYLEIAKKFISKKESVSLKAYFDARLSPLYTIGWGHDIQTTEISRGYLIAEDERIPIPARVADTVCTQEQADKLRTTDFKYFASSTASVLGDTWTKLNDPQKAAMMSYCYNAGAGGFASFINSNNFKSLVAQGNLSECVAVIRDKGVRTSRGQVLAGLVTRRGEEAQLFGSKPFPGSDAANSAKTDNNTTVTDGSGNVASSSTNVSTEKTDVGIRKASGGSITNTCPVEYLGKPEAYSPPSGIGQGKPTLTQLQTKAMHAELGYFESQWAYDKNNKTASRIGKYQVDAPYLAQESRGYIKQDAVAQYKLAALVNEASWTGAEKINSQESFFVNKNSQDTIQYLEFKENYAALKANGGIKEEDDICVAAGMLFVAHQFRSADLAKQWRDKGELKDDLGVPGEVYFNHGRYAIDVLSVNAATGTGVAPGAGGENTSGVNPDDVFTFTGTGSGTRASFDQLNGEFKTQICKMGKLYKDKTGSKIQITSAVRSQEQQTVLYEAWLAAGGGPGNPTVNTPNGRITTPVKSVGSHAGVAIDATQSALVFQTLGAATIAELGLTWGGTWRTADPVHFQLTNAPKPVSNTTVKPDLPGVGGVVVVGDSIAVGTGAALKQLDGSVTVSARTGASSSEILNSLVPSVSGSKVAVISAGSNDIVAAYPNSQTPQAVAALVSKLEAIRSALKSEKYIWILPNFDMARDAVSSFASSKGDATVGFTAGGDQIHPQNYATVANGVKSLL